MPGANLSDSDKAELKKLNEEESTLTNAFTTKLLAATKDAAYVTKRKGSACGPERCSNRRRRPGCEGTQAGGLRSSSAEHDPTTRSGFAQPPIHSPGDVRAIPGIAPNAEGRTIPAKSSPVWLSFAPRRPNCSAFPTTPPGSWKTRWPRRRKPRSSSWTRWCLEQPAGRTAKRKIFSRHDSGAARRT